MKPKCVYCEKYLQPIGHARVNGKRHEDWASRNSHKKCFIQNVLKPQHQLQSVGSSHPVQMSLSQRSQSKTGQPQSGQSKVRVAGL